MLNRRSERQLQDARAEGAAVLFRARAIDAGGSEGGRRAGWLKTTALSSSGAAALGDGGFSIWTRWTTPAMLGPLLKLMKWDGDAAELPADVLVVGDLSDAHLKTRLPVAPPIAGSAKGGLDKSTDEGVPPSTGLMMASLSAWRTLEELDQASDPRASEVGPVERKTVKPPVPQTIPVAIVHTGTARSGL